MANEGNAKFYETWNQYFTSAAPRINIEGNTQVNEGSALASGVNKGSRIQIAAARTCYSPRRIKPEEVTEKQVLEIGRSTYEAGHHTIQQHAQFTFGMDGVSRQFIWSVLHSHPFYNSEQLSQRYTKAKAGNAAIPKLQSPKAQQVFTEALEFAYAQFHQIKTMILPTAEREYFARFPARQRYFTREDLSEKEAAKKKNFGDEIGKKAEEIARYLLPISHHSNLYHTISALSLARLHRMSMLPDSSLEARLVIGEMVRIAREIEPEVIGLFEEPISKDDLLEHKISAGNSRSGTNVGFADDFVRDFDSRLGLRRTRLRDYSPNAEELVAEAVRETIGVLPRDMNDDRALELLLNPAINRQLSDTLYLMHHSKIGRALSHANYTWSMRLSHTADSQEQRQRMTFASRPILERTIPSFPDYETPALINAAGDKTINAYSTAMERLWQFRNKLISLGESVETANMVLPNAIRVRFTESVNLLNLIPKLSKRTCLNAQEELWAASVEQLEDIARVHPRIAKYMGPPCETRYLAGQTPYCPEGKRMCGVPVWNSRKGNDSVSIFNLKNTRTI